MPTARDLAAWIQAELVGDPDVEVRDVGSIDAARPGDAVFALDAKFLTAAEQTPCAVVVTPRTLTSTQKTLLRVDDPRLSFPELVDRLRPQERPAPGIHATAAVSRDAQLSTTVSIGAHAVIESGAQIGERAVVGPGCIVGSDARIGDDTTLVASVTVYHGCRIGARCLLHAGVVVGSDGFGFAADAKGRHRKIRQVGIAVIGDDVEIGANSAIDRATFGETVVGDGTKIDNLVHIGHNVRIGKHVIVCAGVGISGSCEIGDHAVLLGQAGMKDHLKVGRGAIVMPQSGLREDVPDGAHVFGSPARTRMERERVWVAEGKLPELLKRVAAIEKKLQGPG
ncbi:MAG: UDP-3-O-(3-hydroxymyristoyl)glucosamine N-acyltransferase [Candidatus Brocadiae bacterium]|nr:UDP-3-O-(3-hydroxymyristoyl)glucosamine N-acyltransferase [Candidatus Brocadiia bacterium]